MVLCERSAQTKTRDPHTTEFAGSLDGILFKLISVSLSRKIIWKRDEHPGPVERKATLSIAHPTCSQIVCPASKIGWLASKSWRVFKIIMLGLFLLDFCFLSLEAALTSCFQDLLCNHKCQKGTIFKGKLRFSYILWPSAARMSREIPNIKSAW